MMAVCALHDDDMAHSPSIPTLLSLSPPCISDPRMPFHPTMSIHDLRSVTKLRHGHVYRILYPYASKRRSTHHALFFVCTLGAISTVIPLCDHSRISPDGVCEIGEGTKSFCKIVRNKEKREREKKTKPKRISMAGTWTGHGHGSTTPHNLHSDSLVCFELGLS